MAWRKSHPTYHADYFQANREKWIGYREGKHRGPCPEDGCSELKHVSRNGFIYARCHEHQNAYSNELYWRGRSKSEKVPADVRYRRNYLKMRGLTEEQHASLLADQGGRCAVCQKSDKALVIDHDHGCCNYDPSLTKPWCGGCVRGLLCNNCNWAVGLLADDPSRAEGVIAYLSR